MPQCQVSLSCQPSQPLNPDKIEQRVDLTIPKGGSISFKFVKENGKTGSVSDFDDRTLSYVNSEGLYELKKGTDGKHRVNITGEIKSLNAVIKNANGTVAWSGDLVEVGKSAEKKPEEKKVEEPKVEETKATEVRPKEGTPTEGALVDYAPLRLPLPDVSRLVPNPPKPEPRPEVSAPDLAGPLTARGIGSSSESVEPSLKANIPMPMDSLRLVPPQENGSIIKPAPMLDDGSEHLLAPSSIDIADTLFGKIEAGAKAPIDSGLTARSIGSGTSEESVSPFEEVPSAKSVAKAIPAAEEAPKQEPKVNTLDLTKLVPGKTYNYKVIDGPEKGTTGSFTVPTNGEERNIAGAYRGYLHKNEDGSYRFENINPNKCEVTALDGKRAESTISSNSSLGQTSKEKASELSKKDIKKSEREEKREERKLELSDGTKIKLGGKPTELTGPQVKDLLNKYPDQKALIIVGAEWCGPCRDYEPSYTEYAKRNPNVAVIHVDSDQNQEFVSSNSVSGLPTTLLKVSGSTTISPIKEGHVGGMGVSELERRYGK